MRTSEQSPFLWLTGGRHLDLVNPTPDQIEIADIALALSHTCRWTGHMAGAAYSVAQHSCLVSDIVEQTAPEHALAALLHDAHEAYLGDITSPVKHLLGDTPHALAARLDRAIGRRFGVCLVPLPDVVRRWDRHVQRWEAEDIVGVPPDEITRWFGPANEPACLDRLRLTGWTAGEARSEFLGRFERWSE